MTTATIRCALIVVYKPIMRLVFSTAGALTYFSFCPQSITMAACVKCVLFVYVIHIVYSPLDKFPLPPIYLLFLICALKLSGWLAVRFHAGGKILSVGSCRQKYGRHNTISSLVSAILPRRDIPMGTHFCCVNHSQISAGRFLSGHERREVRRGRCKKGERKERRRGVAGLPWEW